MNSVTPPSNKTDEFVRGLGSAVRENPISAALIGMGLVWLVTGARPLGQMYDMADNSGLDRIPERAAGAVSVAGSAVKPSFNNASEGVSRMGETISDAAQNVGENVYSAGSKVADQVGELSHWAPEAAADMVTTLRSNLTDLFHAQPLLLGAVGIAIGAGIAASIPASDVEIELLGETSTSFKNTVSEFVSEQSAKAQTVASGVVTAVAEEGRAQGLTLDGLTAAASDAGEKIKRVATHAGESIKGR